MYLYKVGSVLIKRFHCIRNHDICLITSLSIVFFACRLWALKERVQEARLKSPLFDTHCYTRDLENLLLKIWDRQEKGLPPDHILS